MPTTIAIDVANGGFAELAVSGVRLKGLAVAGEAGADMVAHRNHGEAAVPRSTSSSSTRGCHSMPVVGCVRHGLTGQYAVTAVLRRVVWHTERRPCYLAAMATQADVRRVALSLAGTEEEDGRFAFGIRKQGKIKGYAWVWLERVVEKKPRVPNPAVLAVRVDSLATKDVMINAEPSKFFTEPHYNGFPAVLVRLAEVGVPELRQLLTDAWRCQAPPAVTGQPRSKRATAAKRQRR